MRKDFEMQEQNDNIHPIRWTAFAGLTAAVLFGSALYGCPQYNVWSSRLEGQAELQRAIGNRQIRVQEAEARLESAKFEAQAEVAKAEGAAKANELLIKSLSTPEAYLRWRYIEMLEETAKKGADGRQVIYLPTEAGMPILEAGRIAQAK